MHPALTLHPASPLPTHPSKRHPRTGSPLQAIGYRPDGRPIWPGMGASEDDWSTVFDGKTPAEVKQALEDAQAAAEKTGDGDSPWDELFADQKPEDVKKALEESRKWETRSKANKAKADQLDQLVEAITGKQDDDPDPEKLKDSLTAAQRETRATKVENAVLRRAGKHDGDGALLVDSRSFMTAVADLDPASDTFVTDLDNAIKKAVEDNPTFKVTTEPVRPKPTRQQGNPSEGNKGGSVAAGREAYQSRHGKKP